MAAKKRVFISFDYDNDKATKDFIVGQSKNADSPFEISDWSMKEAAPQTNWEKEARDRIKRSDVVIVMVGPNTYKAPGVLKEVKIAREEGKKLVQIIGYREGNYTAVANAGELYRWNWENLKKLLS
ncbi:MAG: TIR domain-containing protein [Dehalococcoidia bacterium]|nr:TIR domain-containing protein [Dehalococcoidia bacterium]MDD5493800.1 TIR domain-containing protein [Dehalococcoidia bacterium]